MFFESATSRIKNKINSFLVRNSCTILTYHSIQKKDALPFPLWTHMKVDLFEEHLKHLSNHYNCISLTEFVKQVHSGSIQPNSVVVTFDDGYANNCHNALSLLEKYSIPATIYITAGLINTNEYMWPDKIATALLITSVDNIDFNHKVISLEDISTRHIAYREIVNYLKSVPFSKHKDLIQEIFDNLKISNLAYENNKYGDCFRIMSWQEIDTMIKSGLIEIGSHTFSHPILAMLDDDAAINEILRAKSILDKNLHDVTSFAYPNGGIDDFTETHKSAIIEAGYTSISTTIVGRASTRTDLYQLPRKCIGHNMTLNELQHLLTH